MAGTDAYPGEPPTTMTDEEYGAVRTAAALWAGAAVLITDAHGRVLVQHVDYHGMCRLPGGAVDRGESPAHAASRELHEELGVTATVRHALAVDWVPATASGAPAGMRFPGETIFVYDGGTWDSAQIAGIRLPDHEITGIGFVEPARLPELLSPGDARRALSALRARINAAGPAILEDGRPIAPTVLDRVQVLHTTRAVHHFGWRPDPVPRGMPVVQSWGWLFAPDGRVLVLLGPGTGSACLPGGTPEPQDGGNVVATLRREADEEAAAHHGEPLFIGHLPDTDRARARVRLAAALTHVGPVRPDPATGHTYTRILTTPEQALELFDWGPSAGAQLDAVQEARRRLGIPRAAAQPVTELATPVTW
ncbi:NUDIX domain-containing protein [Streptomyces sp. NPDC014734]|uniref:NUDIX hydrolase n=1 Tax=Streptomyces sp. NPDC014734 TaxID=3364886 RepID=UPI0036F62C2E